MKMLSCSLEDIKINTQVCQAVFIKGLQKSSKKTPRQFMLHTLHTFAQHVQSACLLHYEHDAQVLCTNLIT